ncbi:MAG: arylsulfatase [Caulobacterales bacterium]|nr:arylsulfatase [Caulobacterales bacterium]
MLSRRSFLATLLGSTALGGAAYAMAPAAARPNIVTIVLDDVGYSDLGCFGGEIRTPNLDRLAAAGLRYASFDTKAVCSSTRAALLTGRNAHTVNMPDVPDTAPFAKPGDLPPGAFHLPNNAETVPEALRREGYATWLVGKWHLIPKEQLDGISGQDTWPLQRGFDYFYGFARGWTDQYRPDLVENNAYIKPQLPSGYHLSADLIDKSMDLVERHLAEGKGRPFFLHIGLGAAHSPIQVPASYSDRYKGVYDVGWDEIRRHRFARMKAIGLLPDHTVLPPANEGDRAWAELNEDERVVFARFMEVYAGFLEHADEQIGRLLEHLKARGVDRDTMIVVLSDNGAASEAGQTGYFEALYRPNILTAAQMRARLEELGTGKTQAEYPRPWAGASVTPFRRYKLWPYLGGVRTPLIVSWPERIVDVGAIRRQYLDVVDVGPTLLAAAGTQFARAVGGVRQIPVAGRSFLPTLADPHAPAPRDTQYFELRGNRAITSGRWRAVAMHECGKPYEADRWQLFDTAADPSEARDLAAAEPAVLDRLKRLWSAEWARHVPAPLQQPPAMICAATKSYDAPV